MKIKVLKVDLIKLIPENDSDYSLLARWSTGMSCHVASSTYSEKQTHSIEIEFFEPAISKEG